MSTLADFTNNQLVAEIRRRAAKDTFDISEELGDDISLSDDQLRDRCGIEGIELWDEEKAREAGLEAMADTQVFQIAARLAFNLNWNFPMIQAELRAALASEHGVYSPETAELIARGV